MGKVKRVNMLETANEFLEKNQRRLRLNGKAIKKSKIKSAFEVITNDEQEEKKFLNIAAEQILCQIEDLAEAMDMGKKEKLRAGRY